MKGWAYADDDASDVQEAALDDTVDDTVDETQDDFYVSDVAAPAKGEYKGEYLVTVIWTCPGCGAQVVSTTGEAFAFAGYDSVLRLPLGWVPVYSPVTGVVHSYVCRPNCVLQVALDLAEAWLDNPKTTLDGDKRESDTHGH